MEPVIRVNICNFINRILLFQMHFANNTLYNSLGINAFIILPIFSHIFKQEAFNAILNKSKFIIL